MSERRLLPRPPSIHFSTFSSSHTSKAPNKVSHMRIQCSPMYVKLSIPLRRFIFPSCCYPFPFPPNHFSCALPRAHEEKYSMFASTSVSQSALLSLSGLLLPRSPDRSCLPVCQSACPHSIHPCLIRGEHGEVACLPYIPSSSLLARRLGGGTAKPKAACQATSRRGIEGGSDQGGADIDRGIEGRERVHKFSFLSRFET